jgi:N-acetylmuramoyl-L-alanine amidase
MLRTFAPLIAALGLLTGTAAYLSSCRSGSESMQQWDSQLGSVQTGPVTPAQMLGEVRLRQDFIPQGTHARKVYRPMYPRYITIHSTQNSTGDAYAHARALKNGALRATKRVGGNRIGYLAWHFTVQDDLAIQHIPTREQGEHADFDGPGNNYSIGIEMCEHGGNDRAQTLERTAKLAAVLMKQHNLPVSSVVPHYYWPRYGTSPLHKNCPHFLMENGKPGAKWGWFLGRVKAHFNRITAGPVPTL